MYVTLIFKKEEQCNNFNKIPVNCHAFSYYHYLQTAVVQFTFNIKLV